MTKSSLVVFIFIVFSFNVNAITEYKDDGITKVVAPFGFPSRQPPSSDTVVKIIDVKVGIEAQQVCGYTDWTTAQLYLPKQLLSKEYWRKVGKQVLDAAKRTVLNMSGALPGMLVCNVSPTFCAVFNQAELMASFEQSLTFNTCEMLDGVANTSGLQNESLARCIQGYLQKNPSASNSEAREVCLVGFDSDGLTGKGDKVKKTASVGAENGSDFFDFDKFADDAFPGEVKSDKHIWDTKSGNFTYSRREKSKSFLKQVFLKGITLRGSSMVRVSGTFQGDVDRETDKEQKKLENEILRILKGMREYQKRGYSDKDVIAKTEKMWTDKEKWKKDKEPSPIYRQTADDTEPTPIVSPEQILMLLPLADDSKDNLMGDDLKQAISRLTSSATKLKMTDHLVDIYQSTFDVCNNKPEYQGAIAQKNCETIIKNTQASLSNLQFKMQTESEAFKAQQDVKRYITEVQERRTVIKEHREPSQNYFDQIFIPGRY